MLDIIYHFYYFLKECWRQQFEKNFINKFFLLEQFQKLLQNTLGLVRFLVWKYNFPEIFFSVKELSSVFVVCGQKTNDHSRITWNFVFCCKRQMAIWVQLWNFGGDSKIMYFALKNEWSFRYTHWKPHTNLWKLQLQKTF